jgi:hypothetical protein
MFETEARMTVDIFVFTMESEAAAMFLTGSVKVYRGG